MNLFSENKIATAKAFVSTAAQVAATAMVVRSMCRDLMPYEFQDYLFSGIRTFFSRFSSQLTMVIEEFDGFVNNQIYEAAEIYIATIVSPDANRLNVKKADKENEIVVGVERNQEIVDRFEGVEFKWILVSRQVESRHFHNPHDLNATIRSEIRSFSLSFHKKHKEKVLNSYLPYILRMSKSKKQETKALKIHTIHNDGMYGSLSDAWRSVNLDHPANFDTIAMDSDLKKAILDDLEKFEKRKDYYRKVGKAWKRGYLLYGPPGTGKSSLIAAMANYLKFDIYDLELTELRCNSDLRRLLVATANRSILVVEDIDCTIELQDRLAEARALHPRGYHQESQQVTLSGVLNFIDGLWSSCGDERIIVFTTNHKHKLDPALLRPGRMDFHIHMSYCTPCGFKLLAQNYLKITNHGQFTERFKTIEDLLRVIEVTPAEVAEQLLKSDEPDVALEGLVEFMLKKQEENEEAAAKAKEEQENMDNKKKEESGQEEVEGVKENGVVIL